MYTSSGQLRFCVFLYVIFWGKEYLVMKWNHILDLYVSPPQNTGTYYSMGEQTGGCLYREPNSGRIIRACDSEVKSHCICLNIFQHELKMTIFIIAGPDWW